MRRRKQTIAKEKKYQAAMERALRRKPFLNSDGKYLSRDEAHDRERLREKK
jgi:hypothetical protein